jgi:hypothetical protein
MARQQRHFEIQTVISVPIFIEVQVAPSNPSWVDGKVAFAITADKAAARLFNNGPIVTDG